MIISEMRIFPIEHFSTGDFVLVYPGYVVRNSKIEYMLLMA